MESCLEVGLEDELPSRIIHSVAASVQYYVRLF